MFTFTLLPPLTARHLQLNLAVPARACRLILCPYFKTKLFTKFRLNKCWINNTSSSTKSTMPIHIQTEAYTSIFWTNDVYLIKSILSTNAPGSTGNQSKQMFTAFNRSAVLSSFLIGQSNYFRQLPNQLAALKVSGQKLVTKLYFWPVCSEQGKAFK